MLTFNQAIVLSVITSCSTAVLSWLGFALVAKLQKSNELSKFQREKVFDRYSEFAALVAADIERARTIESAIVLGAVNNDFSRYVEVDAKRHELRLNLLRAHYQIQLLERDQQRIALVKAIVANQPFMVWPFPPRWEQPGYTERFEEFKASIASFEKMLAELLESVSKEIK